MLPKKGKNFRTIQPGSSIVLDNIDFNSIMSSTIEKMIDDGLLLLSDKGDGHSLPEEKQVKKTKAVPDDLKSDFEGIDHSVTTTSVEMKLPKTRKK